MAQTDREALLQIYIWMGNAGGFHKDHPWVLFIEKHLRETPDPERETAARLRDEFAGRALGGLLACPIDGAVGTMLEVASECYAYADAMLEARRA